MDGEPYEMVTQESNMGDPDGGARAGLAIGMGRKLTRSGDWMRNTRSGETRGGSWIA